jgi:hypothetical protein
MTKNANAGVEALLKRYPQWIMHGAPFVFPFLDIQDIVTQIRQTNIHMHGMPGVEFALAVHVQSDVCYVLSVWVLYASLQPKNA